MDLETDTIYGYRDFGMSDSPDENNPDDMRNLIINSYDSYLQGMSDNIWMDAEIRFELSQEEIDAINARLLADFTR